MNTSLKDEYSCINTLLENNIGILKNKQILITGANGLIGSYLIDYLIYLNKNFNFNIKIFALSRSYKKLSERFNPKDVNIIEQDLNNNFTLTIRPNYIIHAASNAHPLAYSTDPIGTMKTNLLGTINLLELAEQSSSKFLYFSTGEVYGNNTDNNAFTEKNIGKINSLDLRACYPESKRAAETLCIAYHNQYNIPVNIARLCYIYGPTITETNSRADAQFLRNALNKENIVLKSKGEQKRTYCYVADCISAILTILTIGKNGETYNIANKNSILSVYEYAKTLAMLSNVQIQFEQPNKLEKTGYSKPSDSILDATKLESLGWKAFFDIKTGLEHTIKYKR